MGKCKSCGERIKWTEMFTGKKMPLDVKPMNMIQIIHGVGEVVEVYTPHWATCDKPEKFRKKK